MGDWPNAANDLEALTPHMGAECATKLAEARRKVKKGTTCDHYAVLGLGHEASGSEIKQAYRQLALKMHPDGVKVGNTTSEPVSPSASKAVISADHRRFGP